MARALRRHHIKRVANARRRFVVDYAPEFMLSDNELAKNHPMDCGPRCMLCHYDKFVLGGKRRQAWKREARDEANF